MPSSDLDGALFTDIDWNRSPSSRFRRFRPDGPTTGLLVSFAVVAVLFTYDYLVTPDKLFAALNWDLTQTDWLFLLSVVVFGRYVLYPAAANRERSSSQLRAILRRPAGALSLGFILVFVVISLVGPDTLIVQEYPRLKHRLQPPVLTAVFVEDQFFYNCVGQLSEGYCYGSWQYPLGTDRYGNDMVRLLAESMQVALFLGLTTATIMAVVATTVGTAAGYFRGWVDAVLMWYVDIQQTIPAIVVYIVLATMFLGVFEGALDGGLFAFVLVFGLLDWGGIARLVRSDVLTRRSTGYVRAARAAGASNLQVIRRHVIPNSTATIVTALTRRIPLLILAQTALAYLELNRVKTQYTFGKLLRLGLESRNMAWSQKWWVVTLGVVLLVCTVVAFNVLGDVLRDVLDPTEETRR